MTTVRFHTPTRYYGTWKQNEVMKHVLEAADRGEFLHLSALNKLISWGPVKSASLTTIVKSLRGHGFVKRMYGYRTAKDMKDLIEYTPEMNVMDIKGMMQFIVPTPAAYTVFRPFRGE